MKKLINIFLVIMMLLAFIPYLAIISYILFFIIFTGMLSVFQEFLQQISFTLIVFGYFGVWILLFEKLSKLK